METSEFYRPVNIEFNVTHDGSKMPITLGEFATAEEAQKHMANLTCTNQRLPVARLLDNTEKAKALNKRKNAKQAKTESDE